MKRFIKHVPLIAWIFMVVALVVLLHPLGREGFFISDDGDWMIIRLSAFFQSLREGQFPVRFIGRLNESFGYPVSNFLYPGYLYIGSILHILGLSFVDSVKAIFGVSIIGGAFFIYGWLRKYFKPLAASGGAVSFIALPYIGFDLYTRGSAGEILAFFALSMALYSIAHSRRTLGALSVGLLIVAHNSLALLFMLCLGMYLLYERKVKEFFVPFVLGFGMSAFFWAPALAERSYTFFETTKIANSQEYFVYLSRFYLIASGLLICGLSMLSWVKHRLVPFFLSIACVSIFLATPASSWLWNMSFLSQLFQFPFRFLSLLAIAVPFLTAAIIEFRPVKYSVAIWSVLALLWMVDLSRTLSTFKPSINEEGYYITNEATTTVQNEYMPRWVSLRQGERSASRIEFYDGQGKISPDVFAQHTFRVSVLATQDSILQINTVYYPGWSVAVDGQKVKIDYSNLFGLMRFPLKAGDHIVDVAFRETPFRFIIDCISIISGVLFLVFAWQQRFKVKVFKKKRT
jgi:hypothetical protein